MKTYNLKIILDGSNPQIWRTVKVNGDFTLQDLHHAIQVSMGWYNCHLHQFVIANEIYGVNLEDDWGESVNDESKVKICKLLKKGDQFYYEYDFGDGWQHFIKVLDVTDENILFPICTDGKRNCPPEDIGGIYGYENFVEIMKNPKHPEYEEYIEWHEGSYNPELFDIKEVNKLLAQSFVN